MERLSLEQLKCVQSNRRSRGERSAPVPIGQVAAKMLDSDLLAGPAWRRRLLAVLAERAAPLLRHASIVDIRNGVLRLCVREPAVMYGLRVRWEQPVLDLLRAEFPAAGIRELRFTAGTSRKASG